MLELQGVGRDYTLGATVVRALDAVDLQLARGESLALLGPSGSGKSTLLQVLGCLDQPSRGSYRLDGVEVSGLHRNELAALRCRKVGFVFQRFHLMPRQTALQNVMLPLRFAGVEPRRQRARAEELLARVGLADRMRHRPSELSGGQQQRVAVARALANDPCILLADEPTGNLDSRAGEEVLELLLELHAAGTTLVVVTHDEELAGRMQGIVRLHDGRIVADSRAKPVG
ncbi:MAG: macrolide ABC transporter ATP-binding protein [Planctomycetes bacterium]|nr:macrolide ABC transporter ATP-binding protein [Planctomycetota bacterium]